MVDGTGLENQQINVSQVRILSLPPCSDEHALENRHVWRFFIFGLNLIVYNDIILFVK